MGWALAWRHAVRQWGITLLLVANVLFGATVAAALPLYGAAVADAALRAQLQAAPAAVRNLSYRGNVSPLHVEELDARLGPLVRDRVQFRQQRLAAVPTVQRGPRDTAPVNAATFYIHLWSVQPLSDHAELVAGRMPRPITGDPGASRLSAPLVEAVIGEDAAAELGVEPGARVRAQQMPLDVEIVGIVRPVDPTNEIWRDEADPAPFSAWRRIGFAPDIDELTVALLLPTLTMQSFVTPNSEWRYVLDHDAIDGSNVDDVENVLLGARAQLADAHKSIDTGLIGLIDAFQAERRQAILVSGLLLVQSLLALLLGVGLYAHFAVEQARTVLMTLAGRGFAAWQQALLLAMGVLPLLAVAAVVAPGLGWIAVRRVAAASADLILARFDSAAWALAAGVAVGCWLTLFGTAYRSARRLGRTVIDTTWRATRQTGRPPWVLELFLLVLGVLAYWQLRQLGGESADGATGVPDLLLAVSPTLILVVGGLIVARLLPWLMRGGAWLARQTPGLLWVVGTARLARAPGPTVQLVVLLVWTTALTVFAAVSGQAIGRRQADVAFLRTGADVRVLLDGPDDPRAATLAARPDVLAASRAVRGTARVPDPAGRITEPVPFLAVEPETLPRVSVFPPGVSPFTLQTVVNTLRREAEPLPVIISADRALNHLNRGDRLAVQFDLTTVEMEVVAIIDQFPTLDGAFIIAPLPALAASVDLTYPLGRTPRAWELWLNVDNAAWQMPAEPPFDSAASATETLTRLRQHLITRQASAGLQLNASVLAAITVAGFITIQYFAFQRRAAEIAVLRALGVGRRQWLGALAAEAGVVLLLSTAAGIGFGYGLAWLMQPLTQSLLVASLGETAPLPLALGWRVWGGRVGALVVMFAAALIVLQLLLARIDVARRLRAVQE